MVSVRLRFSKMWLGRKVLAVGESMRGRDLPGKPQIHMYHHGSSSLTPELSFKGAPSPTLSQRWIAIWCLICRVDSVDLNVPLKFITAKRC